MEKSIENIWKNGFIQSNELIAPKVIAFYNMKSKMSISKEEDKMRLGAYLMIPAAALMVLINYFVGNDLIWGLLSAAVMIPWTFLGLYQLKRIKKIDFQDNCYQYLLAFKLKRDQLTKFNRNLGLLSIPIIMTPMIIYSCIKKSHENLGEMLGIDALAISNWYLFLLIPIMLLLSYFVSTLIINRSNKKDPINKLIRDMDELK